MNLGIINMLSKLQQKNLSSMWCIPSGNGRSRKSLVSYVSSPRSRFELRMHLQNGSAAWWGILHPLGTSGHGVGSNCTPLSCCFCWDACIYFGRGKDDTPLSVLACVPALMWNEPEKVIWLRSSSSTSGSWRLWRWRSDLFTLGQDREAYCFQGKLTQSFYISLVCSSGKLKLRRCFGAHLEPVTFK